MTRNKLIALVFYFLFVPVGHLFAQSVYLFTQYHNGSQVQQMLKDLQKKNSPRVKLHEVAVSPGGTPVMVLEIGADLKNVPAVFAGANFEGNNPLATSGALRLAQMLLDTDAPNRQLKWFIMPLPNPDASENFFEKVKYGRTVNDFAVNDDGDEAVNEDGFEDLNNDGFITMMRVKSPEGTYMISPRDNRIMVQADTGKGERGAYKLFTEGIDNDADGLYNEDGDGGINPGISFPHLFPENRKDAGQWPGQAPEVYGIMRFIYSHPEIAMVFTLGNSDFCIAPPASGRKGDFSPDRIKIPVRYARMFNVDENQTYNISQVVELAKEYLPAGTDVTPASVAGLLGLGPAVNPLPEDLEFYSALSRQYREFLQSNNFRISNSDPEPAKDGSFELWAYYNLGVPSFSMRLFTVPDSGGQKDGLSIDEIRKMNATEIMAVGEEKAAGILKMYNAPAHFTPTRIFMMMKNGELTPGQLADSLNKFQSSGGLTERERSLLKWSDLAWEGKGFVNWQPYRHPSLGEVEIGGFIPYLETTPPPNHIDSLLNAQVPWLIQLAGKLPRLSFSGEKITPLGGGVYRIELFVENSGFLPWPIAMGQRNSQPAPVVVVLNGNFELLEGLKRQPLGFIGANQVKKLTWLIRTDRKAEIEAAIESAVFENQVKQIKTGG